MVLGTQPLSVVFDDKPISHSEDFNRNLTGRRFDPDRIAVTLVLIASESAKRVSCNSLIL